MRRDHVDKYRIHFLSLQKWTNKWKIIQRFIIRNFCEDQQCSFLHSVLVKDNVAFQMAKNDVYCFLLGIVLLTTDKKINGYLKVESECIRRGSWNKYVFKKKFKKFWQNNYTRERNKWSPIRIFKITLWKWIISTERLNNFYYIKKKKLLAKFLLFFLSNIN